AVDVSLLSGRLRQPAPPGDDQAQALRTRQLFRPRPARARLTGHQRSESAFQTTAVRKAWRDAADEGVVPASVVRVARARGGAVSHGARRGRVPLAHRPTEGT